MPESRDVSLELVVRVKDLTSQALKRVGQQGSEAGKRIAKGFRAVQTVLRGVRRAVSLLLPGLGGIAAIFAGGLAIGNAVRAASDFRTAMAEVSTIVDTTVVSMDEMRKAVLGIAAAQGSSELTLAKGLYQAISAGVEGGARATEFLADANRLAVASVAETNEAVDLLTSAINAYKFDLEQTTRISDIFFTTVRRGKTTIPELSSAFSAVAPIAAELGISLEQVNSAIATLTLGGATTSEAVTRLASVLRAFLNKSDEINALLRSAGKEAFTDTTFQARTLADVLEDLRDATNGSQTALAQLLVRAEATLGVFGLTGTNASIFADILRDVEDASGAVGLAFDKQIADPAKRAQIVLNSLRIELVEMGDEIIIAAAEAIDLAGGMDKVREAFSLVTTTLGEFTKVAVRSLSEVVTKVNELVSALGGPAKIQEAIVRAVVLVGDSIRVAIAVVFQQIERLIEAIDSIPGVTARTARTIKSEIRSIDDEIANRLDVMDPGPRLDAQVARLKAERQRLVNELSATSGEIASAILGVDGVDVAIEAWKKSFADFKALFSGDGAAGPSFLDVGSQAGNEFVRGFDAAVSGGSAASLPKGAGFYEAYAFSIFGDPDELVKAQFNAITRSLQKSSELASSLRGQALLDAFGPDTLGATVPLLVRTGALVAQRVANEIRTTEEMDRQLLRAQKIAEQEQLRWELADQIGKSNLNIGAQLGIGDVLVDLDNLNRRLGQQIAGGSFDALRTLFRDVASGAKKASDAIKELGRNFVKLFADIFAQIAAKQVVTGFFSGVGLDVSKLIPGFEKGGVMPGNMIGGFPIKAYAGGGVADSPQVAVFGEGSARQFGEAFVPLGGNRKIPVEMRGGAEASTTVALTLNVGSLDPRTAAQVIMGNLDKITDGVARAIQSGRNRNMIAAIRGA